MSDKTKLIIIGILRVLVGVGVPTTMLIIELDPFHKQESLPALLLITLGLGVFLAVKGIIKSTNTTVPPKYRYILPMLSYTLALVVALVLISGIDILQMVLMTALTAALAGNILSMPLNIWYNAVLYRIYGDKVLDFIDDGLLERIKKIKK